MTFLRYKTLTTKTILSTFLLFANLNCATAAATGSNSGSNQENPQRDTIRNKLIRHDYKEGEITNLCDAGLKRLNERLGTDVKNAMSLDYVLADASDEI